MLIPILDGPPIPVVFLGELTCFTHEVLKVKQNPFNCFKFMYTLAVYLTVLMCAKSEWLTVGKTKGK